MANPALVFLCNERNSLSVTRSRNQFYIVITGPVDNGESLPAEGRIRWCVVVYGEQQRSQVMIAN